MNNASTSLSALALEINELDEQALIYAAKCGHKLLEAKARYKHGEFADWIESHCKITPTQANKYMQTAVRMPDLFHPNSQILIDNELSIEIGETEETLL